MMRKMLAILLIAGACNAYPHEDERIIEPIPNPISPEKDLVNPERGPLEPDGPINQERYLVDPVRGQLFDEGPVNPETNPVDPKRDPLPVENGPVPTEVPEDIPGSQNGPKPDESDLKTDATFWWPFYRSWWGYPTYRSYYSSYPTYRTYWSYPTYRTYYSYYYW
ncbi:uncharacterized protein LOC133527729 isoform X2 [Cydia pomonella]|uniref:uncharacterized protein LOC133527729 isoform X2 n=1 Tax=Cydia pomonella TaxID=82600 RepID=UPI002ADDB655|nr:uncharacterized protein LOC133527729 isoform X2 [Cydia pomonella]